VAETLPASWYHDPRIYEAERREVFGREWLLVARSAQLAARGQYVTADIAGWSIVVVALDDAGELRAFHNVCRHRAGPLVDAGVDAGSCGNSFVCRYHGWSNAHDGARISTRDFVTTDLALWGVRVEAWRGLVFVNLDAHAPPLLEALGGFADACAGFPMEKMTFTGQLRDEIGANWKAYADNYLEGYHIPLVHRELNRQIDAKRYTVEVGDGWCRHHAPARDGSPTSGTWLWRFPNLALNLYPDGMNIERFLPVGPRRTQIVYEYLFRDGTDADTEASMKLSSLLLDEDRTIVEAVQRNLETGVYDTGRLSPRHEGGVAAFQARVRDRVVATLPPDAT
jgi:choline monooxygenase